MQNEPFDADKTMLFRPAFSAAGAGKPPAPPPSGAPLELRQIGALGAMNPLVAAANPLLMTFPPLPTPVFLGTWPPCPERFLRWAKTSNRSDRPQGWPENNEIPPATQSCT